MNTELVSVIVPVYNVQKYLPRCVDSIINQTYKNLDIILVDDGSTDESGKICDEYAAKDARIKVIHKENGGQASARNVALDKIRGGTFLLLILTIMLRRMKLKLWFNTPMNTEQIS